MPPPIYEKGTDSESPKVLGGIKIGLRKLVVVTGASSGLGRECAKALCNTGNYFVVMAVRDVEKGKAVAKKYNFPDNSYTVMKVRIGLEEGDKNDVLKKERTARRMGQGDGMN